MKALDEPWDLLCEVRALAVLTPLGFGFKTTIVDALAAGCHVLVHPVLAKRLPDIVRSACIEFEPHGDSNATEILKELDTQPAGTPINAVLQERARDAISSAMFSE